MIDSVNEETYGKIKGVVDKMDLKPLSDIYLAGGVTKTALHDLQLRVANLKRDILVNLNENEEVAEQVGMAEQLRFLKQAYIFFNGASEKTIKAVKDYCEKWPELEQKLVNSIRTTNLRIRKFNLSKKYTEARYKYAIYTEILNHEEEAKNHSLEEIESAIDMTDENLYGLIGSKVDTSILEAIKKDPSIFMYGYIFSHDSEQPETNNQQAQIDPEEIDFAQKLEQYLETVVENHLCEISGKYINDKFNEAAVENYNKKRIGFETEPVESQPNQE